jgi:hypothetical protein
MSDQIGCGCGTKCGTSWEGPKEYLFGLVQVWPGGMWSVWCPTWAQPAVMWLLRRLG